MTDVIDRPAASSRGLAAQPPLERFLPRPPTDEERDTYLGPQHRWVVVLSFLSSILTVLSVGLFVTAHTWSVVLLLPLTISAVGSCLSLFTSSRRRRDTLGSHRARVAGWDPPTLPSVDVLLPSAGEPLVVLENTFAAVARLVWDGGLTVVVLDDSGRTEVRGLALAHGFTYLSRPDRGVDKKAGNLRYGYARTVGDVVAVFDADFAPRHDFLFELAPYLDEPDVGIVQSPQYFDLDTRMNWLQYGAGATQVLFYRWVQPARDAAAAAICVGTSALYRRSALAAAGGFAKIGHSEDVHTGVNVTAAGYRVRFVPTLVAKGLCPDDLGHFLTQQYRWCTGSMSLLLSRRFHAVRLTTRQRAAYWSGFSYYIGTAFNVFFTMAPPVLVGLLAPGQMRPQNYVFVLLALLVRQAVVPAITLGRDSMVNLMRVQLSYSFAHAVALSDIIRGKTAAWIPTGAAGTSSTSVRILRLIRCWLLVSQTLLWATFLWRLPEYGLTRYGPLALVAALQLVVVLPVARGRADVGGPLDPMTLRRRLGTLR